MAGRPATHVNFLAALPLMLVCLRAANPDGSFSPLRLAALPTLMPSRISSAPSVVETSPKGCPEDRSARGRPHA